MRFGAGATLAPGDVPAVPAATVTVFSVPEPATGGLVGAGLGLLGVGALRRRLSISTRF